MFRVKQWLEALVGKKPEEAEPTELDLEITPTDVPYLVRCGNTIVMTSPKKFAFRARVGTADME